MCIPHDGIVHLGPIRRREDKHRPIQMARLIPLPHTFGHLWQFLTEFRRDATDFCRSRLHQSPRLASRHHPTADDDDEPTGDI